MGSAVLIGDVDDGSGGGGGGIVGVAATGMEGEFIRTRVKKVPIILLCCKIQWNELNPTKINSLVVIGG